METQELLKTFRGIELLYKGVDISPDDFTKKPTGTFCVQIDDEVKNFIRVPNIYIVRHGVTYKVQSSQHLEADETTVDTSINLKMFYATLKVLKDRKICNYNDIDEDVFDPSIMERLETIDKTFDYTKAYDCAIKNELTIDATDFEVKTLLAMCNYPEDLGQKMYESYKQPKKFMVDAFKDFEVIDNRIIIPLSDADKYRLKKSIKKYNEYTRQELAKINAIVISKNLNDYFYCSYGNAFQSCFSLNSGANAWYGYMPFSMADESFIIYGTTGAVNKTGIISGKKFHSPNMIFRAWGYASDDKRLVIDKRYMGNEIGRYAFDIFLEYFAKKFNAIISGITDLYNNGKGIYDIYTKYSLYFYSDSLRYNKEDEEVYYSYALGMRGGEADSYRPEWQYTYGNLIQYGSNIRDVVDTLDLSKPAEVVDGILLNPKICPMTGLKIAADKDVHPYGKYLSKPVKNLLVLMYIDGYVFAEYKNRDERNNPFRIGDEYTGGFQNGLLYVTNIIYNFNKNCKIALKPLKELLKGHVKNLQYHDAVLLKIVEDDKITCQVFKK